MTPPYRSSDPESIPCFLGGCDHDECSAISASRRLTRSSDEPNHAYGIPTIGWTPPARSSEDPDYEEATHQDGDGNPAPPGHRDAARSSEEPLDPRPRPLTPEEAVAALDQWRPGVRDSSWLHWLHVKGILANAVRDRGADPKDLDEGRLVSRSLNRDRGADPLREALLQIESAAERVADIGLASEFTSAVEDIRAALGEEPHGQ